MTANLFSMEQGISQANGQRLGLGSFKLDTGENTFTRRPAQYYTTLSRQAA